MKSEDLRDWIDSLTQDITFEYLGVNGSICPFSRSDISLCYGEKEQSFDSIDARTVFQRKISDRNMQ